MGAYQKLNLQTLQNIISIQLRCFKQEGIKKFIFCLRDFDEEHESLGDLESTIRESMAEIWAQIKKPDRSMKSKDVYSIEVFPFRSYRTNLKGFLEDCSRMRVKLEGYRKLSVNNLPLDGFVHYLKSSWEIIQSNKDLNIPDQKRIVANVRCKEEANEIYTEGKSKIEEIKNSVGRKSINTLVSSIKDILSKSHVEYDKNTTYYDDKAKKEHKEDLKKKFSDDMKSFLKLSFDRREDKLQNQVEIMLKQMNQKKELGIEAFNDFRMKKLDLYSELDKYKGAFNFEGTDPNEICKEKKEKLLQQLKIGLGNLYVKIVDNLIRDKMREIKKAEDDLFEVFSKETFEKIINETHIAYTSLEEGLKEVREEDPMLFSEMNESFFESLKLKIFGRMKEKLENLNLTTMVIRAFKKRFMKDKNNIPRKWKKIELDSINTLYRQERKSLINQVKFLNDDILINGERIEFRISYVDLREAIESEIEAVYNTAVDKHHAGNALKNIPKVS